MHVYMVGIKGVAMTALALCYQDKGFTVSGSDVNEAFVTEKILQDRQFHIFHEFSPDHITQEIDFVVYTGAHNGQQNPEVIRAKELGIPAYSHAQALGMLMEGKKVISICGTGGKSTTTAMISLILDQAGLRPSFAVGVGNVPDLKTSGRYEEESEWFVAEADEYAVDPTSDHRPRFVYQKPEIIVCTNLKYDHPDIYPNFEAMKDTFLSFFNTLPTQGLLVINGEDSQLVSLCKSVRSDIHVLAVVDKDVVPGAKAVKLQVPGEHNKRNAAYAYAVALSLGIRSDIASTSLSSFSGTMRRFEYKGKVHGAAWYDDYAHTPDEIMSTLQALREQFPTKKIIAVFQPHTYSRTQSLFEGFSKAFSVADEVILLDIFASAREKKIQTITSDMLVADILKHDQEKRVKNMKTIAFTSQYLSTFLNSDVVVMTLGAGDVYKLFDEITRK